MSDSVETTGGEGSEIGGGLPDGFFDAVSSEVIEARREASEAKAITGKLKEVFSDKKESNNPLGWYDDVLDSLLEAEKNNRSMPMTAKLAAVLAETQKGLLELREETKRKDEIIKKLQNPITGKIIDVLVDRNCPAGNLWLLSRKNIAYYPFRPFFYERLAKTKDTSAFGQVVGEYGLVIAYDKSHGAVKEFSSTL